MQLGDLKKCLLSGAGEGQTGAIATNFLRVNHRYLIQRDTSHHGDNEQQSRHRNRRHVPLRRRRRQLVGIQPSFTGLRRVQHQTNHGRAGLRHTLLVPPRIPTRLSRLRSKGPWISIHDIYECWHIVHARRDSWWIIWFEGGIGQDAEH